MAEASPDFVTYTRKVSCDLCGQGNTVAWYCAECRQNSCNTCENVHSKSTASKLHAVTPVRLERQLSSRASVASDFVGITQEVEICSLHKGEMCTQYCNLCEIFVCSHCVKEMHRTHHIMNIDDTASAKLRELNKKLNALEHYEADRLNKKIESIEEDKLQYLKKTSEQRMDVRNRNEKIMDILSDLDGQYSTRN